MFAERSVADLPALRHRREPLRVNPATTTQAFHASFGDLEEADRAVGRDSRMRATPLSTRHKWLSGEEVLKTVFKAF